jgi:Cactus-binding C-terminus of cactin protein/Conserved mid region of cactin
VAKDVTEIFKGKTTKQLDELKAKIESKICHQTDGVDIGYWESLLSQLKAHMARARLRDRHQENLKLKLEMLKQEQDVKKEEEEDDAADGTDSPKPGTSRSADAAGGSQEESEDEGREMTAEMILLEECFELYKKGNYSPRYLASNELEPATEVITEEDDEQRLEFLRKKVINQHDTDDSKDEYLRREARKGMGSDEAVFSVETKLDSQVYLWSDKYRPRKPRYFNRVHTGFEWNKYNQTHYDMDNPPPKIVQGYKFNIFYPDLIDKQSTPQYFLTPCTDNGDFATLRFHAGPPYEDIAFKIVNREWEFSYKRGFRCQFHNNIFQLWFHFKRYRYRR